MLGYLELLLLVEFVYLSVAVGLAVGVHLILGHFGIATPRWAELLVAVAVLMLTSARAYLTARTMYSQHLGLLKAHRSGSAEMRAVLSFLPLVGHLFGSERVTELGLGDESTTPESEPDVRESPHFQLYVAVFLILLAVVAGFAAFGSFSWIALSIAALVGLLAYQESPFSR